MVELGVSLNIFPLSGAVLRHTGAQRFLFLGGPLLLRIAHSLVPEQRQKGEVVSGGGAGSDKEGPPGKFESGKRFLPKFDLIHCVLSVNWEDCNSQKLGRNNVVIKKKCCCGSSDYMGNLEQKF